MRPCPSETLVVLVAPGGYGKRFLLETWAQSESLVLWAGGEAVFSEDYFAELELRCQALGLPLPEQGRAWVQALPTVTVCLPDWEQIESLERVQQFWEEVLLHQPPQLKVMISARRLPRLPLSDALARGGVCWDTQALSWVESEAQTLFQSTGVDWTDEDYHFWQDCQGWPAGLLLHLRRRQGNLAGALFDGLLQQAFRDYLPPFITDPAQLWLPELQPLLTEWQCQHHQVLPVFSRYLTKYAHLQAAYWLWRSTEGEPDPLAQRVLLERALSLCTSAQGALSLSILTRLAHNASLSADSGYVDQILARGSDYFASGHLPDQAAWLYLQANRHRQCCRYAEAHAHLDQLLAMPAHHITVLDFQTRARILRGLTAYQQGDYEATRLAYQAALYLAALDQRPHLRLELEVMLVFLDRLTGVADAVLPIDLEAQIAALPLGSQPLLWLNLAFCLLLGEQLDLKQGQHILTRVRETADALGWQALHPLRADIEARLWRFHKELDRAEHLHHQALAQLDPQTFDWLYASLNRALTLLRQREHHAARSLLETVCVRAQETGSWGILREAQTALHSLLPEAHLPQVQMPIHVRYADGPRLEISCFGSLQVRLEGQLIERWPRKRARHLLVQLLLHPHGFHRETLADWLTGSEDLEQALRSLDVHVHALRKLLEPQRKGKEASRYIRFHDACYSFGWDTPYHWDVQLFDHQYQQWLQLRERDSESAERAVDLALARYQGPFLPELDFADDWLAERESYARKASDLVLWSAAHLMQAGQQEAAAERAETLLRWDPLSEAGYRWLLQIVAKMNDRSRLERLGERMEQTFEKEWGGPPPRELRDLYRRFSKPF